MTFKEFVRWCNDRACDGCWGFNGATICIEVMEEVKKQPFYKREKFWHNEIENDIYLGIVKPINDYLEKIADIKVGDTVMTNTGIVSQVVKVEDDYVYIDSNNPKIKKAKVKKVSNHIPRID